MKVDTLRALETTEKVIAALTVLDERDGSIDRLIRSISDDRTRLLAATLPRRQPSP